MDRSTPFLNTKHPFLRIQDGISRPYLPVTYENPNTRQVVRVLALVDTGADECALPSGFASVMGYELLKGESRSIMTGNGITTAYRHTLVLRIYDLHLEDVSVDFLSGLTTPLLGVRSFLYKFTLKIDYPNREFAFFDAS